MTKKALELSAPFCTKLLDPPIKYPSRDTVPTTERKETQDHTYVIQPWCIQEHYAD
jgi:hypothetical protein